MRKFLHKRKVALFIIFIYVFTNHSVQPALAQTSSTVSVDQTASKQLPLDQLSKIKIPERIGSIDDFFIGTQNKAVVLIQDAHSIPDAQRSIRRLISFFQHEYGVGKVALEGAGGKLDPSIFRSFPDREIIKNVFRDYFDTGELAGGMAAAIFNQSDSIYQGIEDWDLYEQALLSYVNASRNQEELIGKLDGLKSLVEKRKKQVYSRELLAIDAKLEAFYENKLNLIDIIKVLSEIKRPESGTQLETLLTEIEREKTSNFSAESEIKQIARQIKSYLMSGRKKPGVQKSLEEFNSKLQAYMTSRSDTQAFAFFLNGLIEKYRFPIKISNELLGLAKRQKSIEELKGTTIFDEFEDFVSLIKDELIINDAQRQLSEEVDRIRLLRRFTKLEINHEEWDQIKSMTRENADGVRIIRQPMDREVVEVINTHYDQQIIDEPDQIVQINTKDYQRKTVEILKKKKLAGQTAFDAEFMRLLIPHYEFYKVATQREVAFYDRLYSLFDSTQEEVDTVIFVSGGFHTRGLTELFKAQGVSYLLLTPQIDQLPEEKFYPKHMRGELSWRDYFEVEGGKVNLYNAFVRAARDKLIRVSDEKGTSQGKMLKMWRDQVIRDLSEEKRIQDANKYTRFMDEVVDPSFQEKTQNRLMQKTEQFIDGLKQLEATNQLTRDNILKLFSPATAVSTAGPVLLELNRLTDTRVIGMADARSEIRKNIDDFNAIEDVEGLQLDDLILLWSKKDSQYQGPFKVTQVGTSSPAFPYRLTNVGWDGVEGPTSFLANRGVFADGLFKRSEIRTGQVTIVSPDEIHERFNAAKTEQNNVLIGVARDSSGKIQPVYSDSNEFLSVRDTGMFDISGRRRDAVEIPLRVSDGSVSKQSFSEDWAGIPESFRSVLESNKVLVTDKDASDSPFSVLMTYRPKQSFQNPFDSTTIEIENEGRTGILLENGLPIVVSIDGQEFVIDMKGIGNPDGGFDEDYRVLRGGARVIEADREEKSLKIIQEQSSEFAAGQSVRFLANIQFSGVTSGEQALLLRLSPGTMRATYEGFPGFPIDRILEESTPAKWQEEREKSKQLVHHISREMGRRIAELFTMGLIPISHPENLLVIDNWKDFIFTDYSDILLLENFPQSIEDQQNVDPELAVLMAISGAYQVKLSRRYGGFSAFVEGLGNELVRLGKISTDENTDLQKLYRAETVAEFVWKKFLQSDYERLRRDTRSEIRVEETEKVTARSEIRPEILEQLTAWREDEGIATAEVSVRNPPGMSPIWTLDGAIDQIDWQHRRTLDFNEVFAISYVDGDQAAILMIEGNPDWREQAKQIKLVNRINIIGGFYRVSPEIEPRYTMPLQQNAAAVPTASDSALGIPNGSLLRSEVRKDHDARMEAVISRFRGELYPSALELATLGRNTFDDSETDFKVRADMIVAAIDNANYQEALTALSRLRRRIDSGDADGVKDIDFLRALYIRVNEYVDELEAEDAKRPDRQALEIRKEIAERIQIRAAKTEIDNLTPEEADDIIQRFGEAIERTPFLKDFRQIYQDHQNAMSRHREHGKVARGIEMPNGEELTIYSIPEVETHMQRFNIFEIKHPTEGYEFIVGYGISGAQLDLHIEDNVEQVRVGVNIFPTYRTGHSTEFRGTSGNVVQRFMSFLHKFYGNGLFTVLSEVQRNENPLRDPHLNTRFWVANGFYPPDQKTLADAYLIAKRDDAPRDADWITDILGLSTVPKWLLPLNFRSEIRAQEPSPIQPLFTYKDQFKRDGKIETVLVDAEQTAQLGIGQPGDMIIAQRNIPRFDGDRTDLYIGVSFVAINQDFYQQERENGNAEINNRFFNQDLTDNDLSTLRYTVMNMRNANVKLSFADGISLNSIEVAVSTARRRAKRKAEAKEEMFDGVKGLFAYAVMIMVAIPIFLIMYPVGFIYFTYKAIDHARNKRYGEFANTLPFAVLLGAIVSLPFFMSQGTTLDPTGTNIVQPDVPADPLVPRAVGDQAVIEGQEEAIKAEIKKQKDEARSEIRAFEFDRSDEWKSILVTTWFGGRNAERFKKLFPEIGGQPSEASLEIVGVGLPIQDSDVLEFEQDIQLRPSIDGPLVEIPLDHPKAYGLLDAISDEMPKGEMDEIMEPWLVSPLLSDFVKAYLVVVLAAMLTVGAWISIPIVANIFGAFGQFRQFQNNFEIVFLSDALVSSIIAVPWVLIGRNSISKKKVRIQETLSNFIIHETDQGLNHFPPGVEHAANQFLNQVARLPVGISRSIIDPDEVHGLLRNLERQNARAEDVTHQASSQWYNQPRMLRALGNLSESIIRVAGEDGQITDPNLAAQVIDLTSQHLRTSESRRSEVRADNTFESFRNMRITAVRMIGLPIVRNAIIGSIITTTTTGLGAFIATKFLSYSFAASLAVGILWGFVFGASFVIINLLESPTHKPSAISRRLSLKHFFVATTLVAIGGAIYQHDRWYAEQKRQVRTAASLYVNGVLNSDEALKRDAIKSLEELRDFSFPYLINAIDNPPDELYGNDMAMGILGDLGWPEAINPIRDQILTGNHRAKMFPWIALAKLLKKHPSRKREIISEIVLQARTNPNFAHRTYFVEGLNEHFNERGQLTEAIISMWADIARGTDDSDLKYLIVMNLYILHFKNPEKTTLALIQPMLEIALDMKVDPKVRNWARRQATMSYSSVVARDARFLEPFIQLHISTIEQETDPNERSGSYGWLSIFLTSPLDEYRKQLSEEQVNRVLNFLLRSLHEEKRPSQRSYIAFSLSEHGEKYADEPTKQKILESLRQAQAVETDAEALADITKYADKLARSEIRKKKKPGPLLGAIPWTKAIEDLNEYQKTGQVVRITQSDSSGRVPKQILGVIRSVNGVGGSDGPPDMINIRIESFRMQNGSPVSRNEFIDKSFIFKNPRNFIVSIRPVTLPTIVRPLVDLFPLRLPLNTTFNVPAARSEVRMGFFKWNWNQPKLFDFSKGDPLKTTERLVNHIEKKMKSVGKARIRIETYDEETSEMTIRDFTLEAMGAGGYELHEAVSGKWIDHARVNFFIHDDALNFITYTENVELVPGMIRFLARIARHKKVPLRASNVRDPKLLSLYRDLFATHIVLPVSEEDSEPKESSVVMGSRAGIKLSDIEDRFFDQEHVGKLRLGFFPNADKNSVSVELEDMGPSAISDETLYYDTVSSQRYVIRHDQFNDEFLVHQVLMGDFIETEPVGRIIEFTDGPILRGEVNDKLFRSEVRDLQQREFTLLPDSGVLIYEPSESRGLEQPYKTIFTLERTGRRNYSLSVLTYEGERIVGSGYSVPLTQGMYFPQVEFSRFGLRVKKITRDGIELQINPTVSVQAHPYTSKYFVEDVIDEDPAFAVSEIGGALAYQPNNPSSNKQWMFRQLVGLLNGAPIESPVCQFCTVENNAPYDSVANQVALLAFNRENPFAGRAIAELIKMVGQQGTKRVGDSTRSWKLEQTLSVLFSQKRPNEQSNFIFDLYYYGLVETGLLPDESYRFISSFAIRRYAEQVAGSESLPDWVEDHLVPIIARVVVESATLPNGLRSAGFRAVYDDLISSSSNSALRGAVLDLVENDPMGEYEDIAGYAEVKDAIVQRLRRFDGRSEIRAGISRRAFLRTAGAAAFFLAPFGNLVADEIKAKQDTLSAETLAAIVKLLKRTRVIKADQNADARLKELRRYPETFRFVVAKAFVQTLKDDLKEITPAKVDVFAKAAAALHPDLPKIVLKLNDAKDWFDQSKILGEMNQLVFVPMGLLILNRFGRGDSFELYSADDLELIWTTVKTKEHPDGKEIKVYLLKSGAFDAPSSSLGAAGFQGMSVGVVSTRDLGPSSMGVYSALEKDLKADTLDDKEAAEKLREEAIDNQVAIVARSAHSDNKAFGRSLTKLRRKEFVKDGKIDETLFARRRGAVADNEKEHAFNRALGFDNNAYNPETGRLENKEEMSSVLAELARGRTLYDSLAFYSVGLFGDWGKLNSYHQSRAMALEALYDNLVKKKLVKRDDSIARVHGKDGKFIEDYHVRAKAVTVWLQAFSADDFSREQLRQAAFDTYVEVYGRRPFSAMITEKYSSQPLKAQVDKAVQQPLIDHIRYVIRERLGRDFDTEKENRFDSYRLQGFFGDVDVLRSAARKQLTSVYREVLSDPQGFNMKAFKDMDDLDVDSYVYKLSKNPRQLHNYEKLLRRSLERLGGNADDIPSRARSEIRLSPEDTAGQVAKILDGQSNLSISQAVDNVSGVLQVIGIEEFASTLRSEVRTLLAERDAAGTAQGDAVVNATAQWIASVLTDNLRGNLGLFFDMPEDEQTNLEDAMSRVETDKDLTLIVNSELSGAEVEGMRVQAVGQSGYRVMFALDNPRTVPRLKLPGTAAEAGSASDTFDIDSENLETISELDQYQKRIMDKLTRAGIGLLLAEQIEELNDINDENSWKAALLSKLFKDYPEYVPEDGLVSVKNGIVVIDQGKLFNFVQEHLARSEVRKSA